MNKSHRAYEFGTFQERLAHVCDLLDVSIPDFPVDDDGDALVCDDLGNWVIEHSVCLNWLLIGNPSNILDLAIKSQKSTREISGCVAEMEPEVAQGFVTMLRAVVSHDLPVEEAMAMFEVVAKEFRDKQAA